MKKGCRVKIAAVFMAIVMIVASMPANVLQAHAAGATAQLTIDSASARPGETVELNVVLKNAPEIKSMSVSNITFDSASLTLTSVTLCPR